MMTPSVLISLVLFGIPMVLLVWMSLNNWPLLGQTSFIGLANYAEAMTDEKFHSVVRFTLLFTVLATPVQILSGYLLAMIVRRRVRGVGVFRAIYFLPVVVGGAAASYMFVVLIRPGQGLIDQVLQMVGLTDGKTSLLGNFWLSVWVVIGITIWKGVGTTMVILMAAMQAVPEEVYEAARVDGAGWLQRETRITLPLITQSMALVLLLTITGNMLAFDQFYIITGGGPARSTVTAVFWLYTEAFVRYRMGYGAALAILIVIVLAIASAIQLRVLREK